MPDKVAHLVKLAANHDRHLQFLIAGTATPAFLLAVPGMFGLICLVALWALTLAAAACQFIAIALFIV